MFQSAQLAQQIFSIYSWDSTQQICLNLLIWNIIQTAHKRLNNKYFSICSWDSTKIFETAHLTHFWNCSFDSIHCLIMLYSIHLLGVRQKLWRKIVGGATSQLGHELLREGLRIHGGSCTVGVQHLGPVSGSFTCHASWLLLTWHQGSLSSSLTWAWLQSLVQCTSSETKIVLDENKYSIIILSCMNLEWLWNNYSQSPRWPIWCARISLGVQEQDIWR